MRLSEMSEIFKCYSIKILLKAQTLLKTVVSALKYIKTRFHTSKLNSRRDKIAFCLDGVIFPLNLFKMSQYSGTEHISSLVLFWSFLRDIGFCRIFSFFTERHFRSYLDQLLC